MKVLLLSPPYLPEYMRNARCDFVSLSHTQWYPIWLGYCGALLEKYGHKVKLIDAPAYGMSHKECAQIILNYKPDFLVIYSSTKSEDNDIEFSEGLVDKLSCQAVFVGPYVSIWPDKILRKTKKINLAVKGEFEYPVLELLQGHAYSEIRNLYYKIEGDVKQNELRPLLKTSELDNIPFIADFFNQHLDFKYYRAPSEYYPFIDLMTGRGCVWGRCAFCLWVHSFIPGPVYNLRSIGNVIEEFRFIKNHIPKVRSIMIQDDTLTSERAAELSEHLLKNDIKIPWSCYVRPNMDFGVLRLMKRAGCQNLHVGYESANAVVLRNIKKGLTFEKMIEFTQHAKKAGLRIHADFAIGFNGETIESIKETIKWAKKLNPDTAQFQLIRAYPTTPLYEYLKKNNYLKDDEPNYPELTNEQIRKLAKTAYREFYLSLRYAKRVILNPKQYLFNQLRTIFRAIPAMFWKRW